MINEILLGLSDGIKDAIADIGPFALVILGISCSIITIIFLFKENKGVK